jgi:hypothetical protein
MIDVKNYRVIYDKYYEEETEASARRLYNQLKSQRLSGDCIARVDFWGEHARSDFQKVVDEIRLKLKEQYEQDLHKLASRQGKQVQLHDKHLAELMQLRQDFKQLCEDYDRQQAQHQQEISTIMQAQHEQIETEIDKAIAQAVEQVQSDFDTFKDSAKQAGNDIIRVLLMTPDEQKEECRRLTKHLRKAGIDKGPAQLRLIAYYLAPLYADDD